MIVCFTLDPPSNLNFLIKITQEIPVGKPQQSFKAQMTKSGSCLKRISYKPLVLVSNLNNAELSTILPGYETRGRTLRTRKHLHLVMRCVWREFRNIFSPNSESL